MSSKAKLICWTAGILCGISTVAHASTLGDDYQAYKKKINDEYGFSYSLTYSLLGQRTAPSGKHNAVQSYLYPAFIWTNFDNEYGTGALNFSYSSVYYGRHNAEDLQNNSKMVTAVNDFNDETQEFSGLYYTYQLPGKYKGLTFGVGQYGVSNFDGTNYDENQQVTFLNYALSQNASSTYTDGGLGAYVQAAPGSWVFVVGAMDATNIEAPSIRVNRLNDKHYTTFGQIGYNPNIKNLGDGMYSFLVYNQPGVKEQSQSTTGWSVNIEQSLGDKLNIFGRINGVSGSVATINQSYATGFVYNNPLDRNQLDQIGLAYAYNKIDETAVGAKIYHSAEQVIEAYWAWGISKWATITPDFQFYFNPALSQSSDYATAASVRLTVFF